jgi:hypothetical protein
MRINGITRATMLAAAVLVLGAGPATAAGGPPPGHGGGGEETLGNNLSVPAIFVPSTAGAPTLRTPCPTDAVAASGPTATYDGIAYYLQQTEAIWSAECTTASAASVQAKWGDNLLNGRALKTGSPIRVEMALLSDVTATGYTVLKLTDELDRYATYGTDGVQVELGARVWDAAAHLRIVSATGVVVYDGPITAEINATGSVVYGYNWGIKKSTTTASGTYTLTFSVSDATTITAAPAGEAGVTGFTAHSAWVTVVVGGGGGGRQ